MFKQIAKNIVDFSLDLHSGENLNIIVYGDTQEALARDIERYAKSLGVATRYFYDSEELIEILAVSSEEKMT